MSSTVFDELQAVAESRKKAPSWTGLKTAITNIIHVCRDIQWPPYSVDMYATFTAILKLLTVLQWPEENVRAMQNTLQANLTKAKKLIMERKDRGWETLLKSSQLRNKELSHLLVCAAQAQEFLDYFRPPSDGTPIPVDFCPEWKALFGIGTVCVPWKVFIDKSQLQDVLRADELIVLQGYLDPSLSDKVVFPTFARLLSHFGTIENAVSQLVDLYSLPYFFGYITMEEERNFLHLYGPGYHIARFADLESAIVSVSWIQVNVDTEDTTQRSVDVKRQSTFPPPPVVRLTGADANPDTVKEAAPKPPTNLNPQYTDDYMRVKGERVMECVQKLIPAENSLGIPYLDAVMPYFIGFSDSAVCVRLLKGKPAYSYFVRFSGSKPGNYIATYNDKSGNVVHLHLKEPLPVKKGYKYPLSTYVQGNPDMLKNPLSLNEARVRIGKASQPKTTPEFVKEGSLCGLFSHHDQIIAILENQSVLVDSLSLEGPCLPAGEPLNNLCDSLCKRELKMLSFFRCEFVAAQLNIICDALLHCGKLHSLSFLHCRFDQGSLWQLVSCVRNKPLRCLDLNSCGITESSLSKVLEVMGNGCKLSTLSLGGNIFTEPDYLMISDALMRNTNITSFDMCSTTLTLAAFDAVLSAVQANPLLKDLQYMSWPPLVKVEPNKLEAAADMLNAMQAELRPEGRLARWMTRISSTMVHYNLPQPLMCTLLLDEDLATLYEKVWQAQNAQFQGAEARKTTVSQGSNISKQAKARVVFPKLTFSKQELTFGLANRAVPQFRYVRDNFDITNVSDRPVCISIKTCKSRDGAQVYVDPMLIDYLQPGESVQVQVTLLLQDVGKIHVLLQVSYFAGMTRGTAKQLIGMRAFIRASVISIPNTNSNETLSVQDVEIEQGLGEGVFGDSYRGLWQSSKWVVLRFLEEPAKPSVLITSARALRKLNNEHIQRFFGIFEGPEKTAYFVWDYIPYGSLLTLLKNEPNIPLQKLAMIGMRCASGFKYLSAQGIIHGNVAARNIMVYREAGEWHVKLADVGIWMLTQANNYTIAKSGFPVKWAAPEVLKAQKFSAKSDVFSFGVVLWEMGSRGKAPWAGKTDSETMDLVLGGERLLRPDNVPDNFAEIINECFCAEPLQRPDFLHLYELLEDVEISLSGHGRVVARERRTGKSESASLEGIEVGQRLGGGHFGDVYQGTWMGTTTVAVKKLKADDDLRTFAREMAVLRSLNHPNIVRFLGVHISAQNEQYLVMEYLSKGSLVNVLASERANIQIIDLLAMAKDAVAGMSYLEEKKIVHRDLALRNFLAAAGDENTKYIVKVSDFGLSRPIEDGYYRSKETHLPVRWCAPEIFQQGVNTSKSDVWAFGVVLWEMFSYGLIPYSGLTNQEVVEKVLSGYRLYSPQDCPTEVYTLMQACWQSNPVERPSFKQLFADIARLQSNHRASLGLDRPGPPSVRPSYEPIPSGARGKEEVDSAPTMSSHAMSSAGFGTSASGSAESVMSRLTHTSAGSLENVPASTLSRLHEAVVGVINFSASAGASSAPPDVSAAHASSSSSSGSFPHTTAPAAHATSEPAPVNITPKAVASTPQSKPDAAPSQTSDTATHNDTAPSGPEVDTYAEPAVPAPSLSSVPNGHITSPAPSPSPLSSEPVAPTVEQLGSALSLSSPPPPSQPQGDDTYAETSVGGAAPGEAVQSKAEPAASNEDNYAEVSNRI